MERFDLSEVQAQAILDMRLGRLQGLEVEKIENELDALHKKIAEYQDILAHAEKIYAIVKQELTEICDKFGDERRTEISMVENELDIEDLIEEEQCAYTLTRLGYIKRDVYKRQPLVTGVAAFRDSASNWGWSRASSCLGSTFMMASSLVSMPSSTMSTACLLYTSMAF